MIVAAVDRGVHCFLSCRIGQIKKTGPGTETKVVLSYLKAEKQDGDREFFSVPFHLTGILNS